MTDQTSRNDDALIPPHIPRQREINADQVRILLEPTRLSIIDLLNDGPATVKQLANALDRPPSSIAHHCDQLLEADLIRVVSTRRVRAIDERFYGRTAHTFLMGSLVRELGIEHALLAEAARDAAEHAVDADVAPIPGVQTYRLRRITDECAAEFQRRLEELAVEFGSAPTGGETRYGFVVGIFATDHPVVTDEHQ